jgi:hypothetical protein
MPVAVGAGMLAWMSYAPATPFDGEQNVELEVDVRDAASGSPIGNALIQISDPYFYLNRKKNSEATTRADGRARIVHRFDVVGECRAYRLKGEVHYSDRWLEVSATGHTRLIAPLAAFTGERGELGHSAPIRVALPEGEPPREMLKDVAGHYQCHRGQGYATLDILGDGRFSWTASGCWSYQKEYGFVRRIDGALSLQPIPHDQHEVTKLLLMPLYPVRWGARAFLLRNDQILDFCNAINQGPEPGKILNVDCYHQGDYWPKNLEGQPELPGEWNSYLLKKPVFATITHVRDDGNAPINRGSEDGIKKGMHLKAHGRPGDRYPYREVEAVAVNVRSSVVKQVFPDCAIRKQLSYFGDGPLTAGEKVTSTFREEGDEQGED